MTLVRPPIPKLILNRKTIPEDRIEWMRGELIRWIARYSNGPAFIRTKLCLAVCTVSVTSFASRHKRWLSSNGYSATCSRSFWFCGDVAFCLHNAGSATALEWLYLQLLPRFAVTCESNRGWNLHVATGYGIGSARLPDNYRRRTWACRDWAYEEVRSHPIYYGIGLSRNESCGPRKD